mmetsp:Transcript_275/g.974  ORF Transcript_275/g.974 Transcript_275/m.974 type:complete len:382 (-) Transcript_275:131-1276(-)
MQRRLLGSLALVVEGEGLFLRALPVEDGLGACVAATLDVGSEDAAVAELLGHLDHGAAALRAVDLPAGPAVVLARKPAELRAALWALAHVCVCLQLRPLERHAAHRRHGRAHAAVLHLLELRRHLRRRLQPPIHLPRRHILVLVVALLGGNVVELIGVLAAVLLEEVLRLHPLLDVGHIHEEDLGASHGIDPRLDDLPAAVEHPRRVHDQRRAKRLRVVGLQQLDLVLQHAIVHVGEGEACHVVDDEASLDVGSEQLPAGFHVPDNRPLHLFDSALVGEVVAGPYVEHCAVPTVVLVEEALAVLHLVHDVRLRHRRHATALEVPPPQCCVHVHLEGCGNVELARAQELEVEEVVLNEVALILRGLLEGTLLDLLRDLHLHL